MDSEGKIIFEGIARVVDFNKDKTWLFIPQTNSELEIDESLDIDHDEFIKMREANVEPNLYCIDIKRALISAGYMKLNNKIKIGRNKPCPCGSGKKYKKCCGSNT